MKIIEFTYSPKTGAITTEAIGYEGTECLAATKPFEDALGNIQGKRSMKKEARLNNGSRVSVRATN